MQIRNKEIRKVQKRKNDRWKAAHRAEATPVPAVRPSSGRASSGASRPAGARPASRA